MLDITAYKHKKPNQIHLLFVSTPGEPVIQFSEVIEMILARFYFKSQGVPVNFITILQ